MKHSRRKFLQNSSVLLAGTAFAATSASSFNNLAPANSPNDRIRLGLIGCRNMGFGILNHCLAQPNVECAALCDVDDSVLTQRSAEVETKQGKKPLMYKDFRKLLDNKDIDAVIIGTPDHWHCYMTVAACQSGKDVYVEKPMANSIGECDLMVKAVRKYNRVVQVGQQQRSGPHWQNAIDYIRQGKIGQLRKTQIWANFNYGVGQPLVPDEPIPPGIDFDMWLGPAPARSFNKARFHGSWRMFWDYGGGLLTDWGVHLMDIALWAGEVDYAPLSVNAFGANFSHKDRAHETFDTMSVNYQLKDSIISWEHTAGTQNGPWNKSYGLAFIGNDATILINRDGWELIPEKENGKDKVPALAQQPGGEHHRQHVQNWIECLRSRKDPVCTVEKGRIAALYTHTGNIAARTESRLVWNNEAADFKHNDAANALLMPAYREAWKIKL
jgi:predicted dehydrogenase